MKIILGILKDTINGQEEHDLTGGNINTNSNKSNLIKKKKSWKSYTVAPFKYLAILKTIKFIFFKKYKYKNEKNQYFKAEFSIYFVRL